MTNILTEMKERSKPDTSKKEITGTIDFIRFSSPESGYCVLSIKRDNKPDCTAVGYMSSPQENSQYKFKGEWKKHNKYGWQFKFKDFELHLPENKTGITRYLESIMYGIGPVRAKKIVDKLGEKTLKRIKEEPEVLEQFDFIEEQQINQIKKDLTENSLQAEFKSSICRRGISARMASKIWTTYIIKDKNPADILKDIEQNPYILINDVDRIGFLTADKIARAVGVEKDSPFRLEAAIKHVLSEATNEGHVYLPFIEISKRIKKLLDNVILSDRDIGIKVKNMCDDLNLLNRESNDVYLKHLYRAEKQLAAQVKMILNGDNNLQATEEKLIGMTEYEQKLLKTEIDENFEYAPEQLKAIHTAFNNNISIITGGPGTGKTTVINSICNIYNRNLPENEIYLASPTGKAAKRMEEATGREAMTIHRLLKYNPYEGGFMYGYEQPLPGPALLIVDEFSMCDIELARDLFAALETNIKVVLVGDIDQLPSVGAGSVLRDLIDSNEVPVTRLKFNYRQANGSVVARMANEIAGGQTPKMKNEGDFEINKVHDNELAASEIIGYVKQLVANDVDPMKFQILSPMRKGDTGVHNLNEKIREIVNPLPEDDKKAEKIQLGNYRQGDKIMVIKNNYDKMVFNGNIGKVVKVEKNKLFVDILDNDDPRAVEFGVEELDLLQLAYATTIHKSQGSEFPIVMMVLTKNHYVMLRRNLLYTGMTRAKDKLILVADPWAVRKAIRNNKVETRFSKLGERLKNNAAS